ncbi:MAG: hypothetical protein JNG88_00175 [Phycisphaerales bacterium]|nr:hypothetical protein [Phycisphaerales bacterium]
MDGPILVHKYQVVARFRENRVDWNLMLETSDGQKHVVPVCDGAELPIILDVVRRDRTIFFDAKSCSLSSGWNDPGDIRANS